MTDSKLTVEIENQKYFKMVFISMFIPKYSIGIEGSLNNKEYTFSYGTINNKLPVGEEALIFASLMKDNKLFMLTGK